MLGLLGMIPGGIKMALVAALVVAAGLFYWHYTTVKSERDAALTRVGQLQVAHEVQQATITGLEEAIGDWKAQADRFQKTLDAMADAQVEANSQARKLNDVLSKHDLAALSLAKPGLVERRINSGSADVLGLFESATAGSKDQPGSR